MTKELINLALDRFTEESRKEYGDILKKVILFGSCARGDFDDESDVDIMVLLDVSPGQLPDEREKIFPIIHQLDSEFNYEILFSPVVQSEEMFQKCVDVLPFYQKVREDGIQYA